MGCVYRAWDPQHARAVALKTLLGASPEARQRFQREVVATARLHHPNIASLHDSGSDPRHGLFLVTDLVSGRSLDQLRLRPRQVGRILAQIARAVQHAHERGVLHRDLKPHNVILDERDQPIVVDFGLALLDERGGSVTRSGGVVGTPAYMAPEQVDPGRGPIDARSDVYGLGATLFDLLVGEPPFLDPRLLVKVLEREPRRPRALQPELDRDLETICLTCLEKDPANRYPSAEALAEELERWLQGDPIEARPIGSVRRAWRWARRRRLAVLGGLALLVAGALVGGTALREHRRRAADEAARVARAARVEAILERAARAPAEFDEDAALAELTRYAEARTVAALAARLNGVTQRLETAERGFYLEAREPTADEALAGEVPLQGLEGALAGHFEGRELLGVAELVTCYAMQRVSEDDLTPKVLGQARTRLVRRARRALERQQGLPARDFLQLLARRQTEALGDGQILLARLTCRTLARLGQVSGAVGPLAAYLAREAACERAVDAVVALLSLRDADGLYAVLQARQRFLGTASFDEHIRKRLTELPILEGELADAPAFSMRGELRVALGDVAAGIQDHRRALALDPESASAWNFLGIALWRHDQPEAAEHAFTRAIQLVPAAKCIRSNRSFVRCELGRLPEALEDAELSLESECPGAFKWVNLALVHRQLGQEGRAQTLLRRALEVDPQCQSAATNLAASYCATDLAGEALKVLQSASRWHAETSDYLDAMGMTLVALQRYEEALNQLNRAVKREPRRFSSRIHRATARLNTGDLHGARQDCELAKELAPEEGEPWELSARIYQAAGAYAEALSETTEALRREPELGSAHGTRGTIFHLLGRPEEALSAYDRALRSNPNATRSLTNRAWVRLTLGDLQGARADLEHAQRLQPNLYEAHVLRGLLHQAKGELDEARADLTGICEEQPQRSLAWLMLGNLELSAGDAHSALRAFRHACAVDPHNGSAWHQLGACLLQQGKHPAAIDALSQAIECEPRTPHYWHHRGLAHQRAGRCPEALADLDRAIELAQPAQADLYASRGQTRLQHGDHAGALRDYRRATQLDPAQSIYAMNIGTIHEGANELEQAAAAYREAIRKSPGNPAGWTRLGILETRRDRAEEAQRAFRRAEALWEERLAQPEAPPDSWSEYGHLLRVQERTPEARKAFDEALQRDDTLVSALVGRGLTHISQGEFAAAQADLERALEITPGSPHASLARQGLQVIREHRGD